MSERRALESELRRASFKLEDAETILAEAREYLERYEFLKGANPGLVAQVGMDIDAVHAIRVRLWDTTINDGGTR